MKKQFQKKHNNLLMLISLFSFFIISCGVKGPPVPACFIAPENINDLSAKIVKNDIVLNWTVPESGRRDKIVGFIIYQSRTDLKKEQCTKCPLIFRQIGKIPVSSKKTDDNKEIMEYKHIISKGFKYVYKIISYTNANQQSKDSNLVTFDYEND